MEVNGVDRVLVALLFPGIVKNDDKALQCLGGIKNISQVYSQPTKKRLGLCYQPENPFIKSTYADSKKTTGILLKVKVKKTKSNNEIKREVVSTSVVGSVKKIYKFESMCDFQYLPVHREGFGQPQCILDQILPSGMDNFDFLKNQAPLFIVPSNFTRSDKPINYTYTDKRYPEKRENTSDTDDVHHKRRSERGVPSIHYIFNLTDDLPVESNEYYIKQKNMRIAIYPQMKEEYDTVQKLFEERPIWSLNLIKYHTKIKMTSLKILLPCLALYMKDGPWRMLWVKFGYDPRKDPGARIYQTLDFRLRHTAGVRSMVMTRDQIVHYKKADRVRHLQRKDDDESLSTEDVSEGAVYFRPGMVPTQRQIFYQYCDVKLPEVEALFVVEPPSSYLCHQKRGWLAPNTDQICRDHIFKYVKQTLLATHNSDLKFEQASSDEEANSEDDETSTTATEVDEASLSNN